MGHVAILGTSSHVGKSIVTAGIVRVLAQEGVRVAPFKAQNMALNAFVTLDGGEIGYAQALQAWAAGLEPTVDMNPILLKPEPGHRSQVIVHGKVQGTANAASFRGRRAWLRDAAIESFERLQGVYDVVVMEGAGSPVELNLMPGDLSNLLLPRHAKAGLILVGDIDRGGVFASLYGTVELLPADDRARLQGLIVNKFRGDVGLFQEGLGMLESLCRTPVLGVLPFLSFGLPEEDSVSLEGKPDTWSGEGLRASVVVLPHVSNFTDLLALEAEPGVSLAWQRTPPRERPDLLIIPGSKATLFDLAWLFTSGWAESIRRWREEGTTIFGICGGMQMLGKRVEDPKGIEGGPSSHPGLGLIPAVTRMNVEKRVVRRQAQVVAAGWEPVWVDGYEIHNGDTLFLDAPRPLLAFDEDYDGWISPDGKVLGTYLHGMLDKGAFRRTFLAQWGIDAGRGDNPIEEGLTKLEGVIREHVGVETLFRLVGL